MICFVLGLLFFLFFFLSVSCCFDCIIPVVISQYYHFKSKRVSNIFNECTYHDEHMRFINITAGISKHRYLFILIFCSEKDCSITWTHSLFFCCLGFGYYFPSVSAMQALSRWFKSTCRSANRVLRDSTVSRISDGWLQGCVCVSIIGSAV